MQFVVSFTIISHIEIKIGNIIYKMDETNKVFTLSEDPFVSYYEIPDSELSLTRNRKVQDFTITTDSYILLCNHLYEALCAENPKFADRVSASAFQYYAVLLLWQRLGQFLSPQDRKLSPFLDKLSSLEPYLKGIPKPLEIYLEGIGNFKHPHFGEMRFGLPKDLLSKTFNWATGTFGKVGADTHFLYEAFPAPGIAALRVLNDLAKKVDDNGVWDLPKDLRPDYENDSTVGGCGPKPTRNLLGWAPAERSTLEQLKLFQASNIESDDPSNELSGFFEKSHQLLTQISAYFDGTKNPPPLTFTTSPFTNISLQNSGTLFGSTKPSHSRSTKATGFGPFPHGDSSFHKQEASSTDMSIDPKGQSLPQSESSEFDRFKCVSVFTTVKRLPFKGSTIQGLVVKRVAEPSEFNRHKMYCDGRVSVHSSWKINDILATGAVVAGYRMPKEPIQNRHSWSCYDFNDYERVPKSWISTRNAIYMFKDIEGINLSMWITGTTEKRLTQYSFLKKHLTVSENMWNSYM